MVCDPLATFRECRQAGTGWSARCPAHEDRRSSLSIGIGAAGQLLLMCHAGCTLDAILAAAHLAPADLFPAKPTTTKPAIVATYRYEDEGGAHLYDVVRFEPKDFRQRRADGVWKMAGVRRVLYGLPELQGQTIAYLVEGEKDADRLRAIGLPSTCNAGGAGKWRSEYVAQLKAASVDASSSYPTTTSPAGCTRKWSRRVVTRLDSKRRSSRCRTCRLRAMSSTGSMPGTRARSSSRS